MARMPGAEWIGPTPNERPDGMVEVRGLVLHIQQGTEDGSESWFKNPAAQASAHFLNPKSGGLRQLVDTKDRAWAEAAGNSHWVSVENEGFVPDSLTASQLENAARLLAWLHTEYGVPLQSTDDPNGHGLGWHGMGGADWGGHYDCPGENIKAQRPQILARAQELLGTPKPKGYTPPAFPTGLQPNHSSPSARPLQRALKATGWLAKDVTESDNYGPKTQAAVAGFNTKHHLADAGVSYDPAIGPRGWALLFTLAYGGN